MKKPNARFIALVAALLATLAGSVALAQGDSPSQASQTGATEDRYAQAEALFPALQGAAAKMPHDVARGVPAGGEYGLDPSRAVAVPAPAGETSTDTWYIVPGTNGVCLALPDSGACATFDQLNQFGTLWIANPGVNPEGVSTDQPESEQAWVIRGLVVNPVSTVTASGAGRGTTGAAEARQGAFLLNLPHGGDTVKLSSADGKTVHLLHVPQPAEGR